MYKIVKKRALNDTVTLMEIEAPHIAKKAKAGQFIIFRVDERGERVPLTIADYDREKGTVTIIFQIVGASTKLLNTLGEGDSLLDFVGPLGQPTHVGPEVKRVCVIGGGVGTAIAYPQAKALHAAGLEVDMIAGFRSKEIVILEEEMKAVTDHLYLMTDDGSYGEKGLVTQKLEELIKAGNPYDLVIAIGPVIMMKFVAATTKPYGIRTLVSLNPIMVDGTGMCGGCRVRVGGQTKFACVDGPDFDGHEVDFDELMKRNSFYKEREMADREDPAHICRLTGGKRHA
ncbi:sulfide/dihydroorotate dehydrogenase-like FAD/NAD-binding protein [Anaerotruncus sp. DFI.9.16]|uniref:sulfide/dihydroorotate dehydrogenase-like FAD/NAD-binding protein n=1 Tax=Anaerotruncus sp. DFI.9.16 TaxID=2965275 RepID=UPI00210E8857|nr:sulfide/dihydroorotate dehydrogenase-like FAD/NAD-binding protein [Anaerotruncus sp. DFI.9.16]MCQ4896842.1 sulfide/dihydroorotate dehydrogenase-like FAD/NAD-binding protein [Anaerotruncus sp. DFI.9.16]